MGKTVTSNIITTFLSWYYITIQKIIRNGQAILEILIFEKSSDLIGRGLGQTGFFPKNRFLQNDRRPWVLSFQAKKSTHQWLRFCVKTPKTSFLGHFGPFLPKFGQTGFFRKNRALSLLTHYESLSSYQKSEKTYDPILRKVSNWQTDRQTGLNS